MAYTTVKMGILRTVQRHLESYNHFFEIIILNKEFTIKKMIVHKTVLIVNTTVFASSLYGEYVVCIYVEKYIDSTVYDIQRPRYLVYVFHQKYIQACRDIFYDAHFIIVYQCRKVYNMQKNGCHLLP